MVTLLLMASKQAHCCHSHSSCCSLLCPDSVALQDERDQAMTTMLDGHLLFCCSKYFPPKYSLGMGRWGGTEGQVRVQPLCIQVAGVNPAPTAKPEIQRARRALQRNNSDGEVVMTLLLVVGDWPPGSHPEVPWWSLQAVTVLSGTLVLVPCPLRLQINVFMLLLCFWLPTTFNHSFWCFDVWFTVQLQFKVWVFSKLKQTKNKTKYKSSRNK